MAACELLVAACGIKFPDQGWNLDPLHLECRVLAAGPSGKSLTHKSISNCCRDNNYRLESAELGEGEHRL